MILTLYKAYANNVHSYLTKNKHMSVNTLAPAPNQPRHEPGEPQDPWGEALEVGEDGRIQLSDEEVAQRYRGIMDRYQPAPETEDAPRPNNNVHNDYIPVSSPEEIVRRNNANMLANFALAHTLLDSHPELIQDLATATENMDTIAFPAVRPDNYQGRHARPRGYRGRHRQ
jgi:hypothetical protein